MIFIKNHEVLTTEREPEGPAQRSNFRNEGISYSRHSRLSLFLSRILGMKEFSYSRHSRLSWFLSRILGMKEFSYSRHSRLSWFYIKNHEVLATEREPEGQAQRSNLGTAFGLHKISRF